MPLPLTTREVAYRLRDYSRENYLLLANVIKGVVLGNATIAAICIVADFSQNWPKIAAFLCSGGAAFISYVTWTRGVLLTNSRSNTRDAVIPLVMGGVEVALFGVLAIKGDFPSPWHFWFFVLAVHAALAVFLVQNRINNTFKEDFDAELRDLVHDDYVGWMRADVAGATTATKMSIIFGIITVTLWWTAGKWWGDMAFLMLPVMPFGFLLYATNQATRQLWKLDAKISEASHSTLYKPGEQVQQSGIYRVMHDKNHTEPYEVTCFDGELFPACRDCGSSVRFALVRSAIHINAHNDFKVVTAISTADRD